MKVDGGCHCRSISYEADIDPDNVGICHCTDCQRLSGSAFRTIALTTPGGFRLLSGTPKVYAKVGDSGAEREQAFCPDCGSPIYSAAPGSGPRIYSIRLGTVNQRDKLPPTFQIWGRSAQSWLGAVASLPAKDTQ